MSADPAGAPGLSDDAKAILGSWFGFMNVDGDLHFKMQRVRPTGRAQAALDELVAAGWLGYSPAQGGGHTYVLLKSARRWCLGWTVDRYYPNSRLRFPRNFRRHTDLAGAQRFAKRHDLPEPQEPTDDR